MKLILSTLLLGSSLLGSCLGQSSSTDVTHVDANTPLEQQIKIAESAAPSEVSIKATIYVLGKNGYEKAREGSNGFTCLVERELPATMEPECFDAQGSETTLKTTFFREAERAKGRSESEIKKKIEDGYKNGTFKSPRKAGIVYMMSDSNYVLDPSSGKIVHFPGHLMFYAPGMTYKDIGLSGPTSGAPYLVHPGAPDNVMVVVPQGAKDEHIH